MALFLSQPITATAKKSRIKRGLIGFLLILVSVCITTITLEVLVRFLPLPYTTTGKDFFTCHNSLGWTGTPNFQGLIEDPAFQQKVTFNALGMHDTEHPLEKTSNTFRILMLGDSFIQAVQVHETNTAHQVLETYLNQQKQDNQFYFEVLSSGVINWGTNQQLVYYREQGRRFKPDLVLLAVYIGNDLADNLPGNVLTTQGINCYAPYFAICDNTINPAPLTYAPGISHLQNNCSPLRRVWINSMGTLYQYSRLYQQIEPLIVANYPRQQFGDAYPQTFTPLYLPHEQPELKQAWQITQATITQLQQDVTRDGAIFGVVLISPEIIIRLGALSPAEQAVFLRDNPTFAAAQLDRPNKRLVNFFKQQDIPFIDLTQPMIEHWTTQGSPLYFLGEGHWTAEGNRLAAELIAQWLVQNKFVSIER